MILFCLLYYHPQMQSQDVILQPIPIPVPEASHSYSPSKRKFPIRLFSLVVLITTLIGTYQSYSNFSSQLGSRSVWKMSREDLLDALEYDNGYSMEEIVLKYKVYRVPLVSYMEPNLILSLCILISFPYVLNFIQKETATPIAFFEFNISGIYMQILRLGVDLAHYLLMGKCICLVSGGAAIWIHLFTKITYYNTKTLLQQPLRLTVTLITFALSFAVVALQGRLDLLIAVGAGLIDVAFIQGGTVKYPKEVFQEKEGWAAAVGVDRWSLWENFMWNQYTINQQLCVNSVQFYVTRKERMIMIS